ncbi:DNA mismatch repair protein MutS [[Clostridium] cellulosi]|uniref:DNA mismatch repair protein MutS n=1 Tax=[Clostridium] cellulosi TaxID=29343 RepID=A0A078KQA4_9FIRM|nr:MAG: DNA mismatch repair protein MutS [[Clostridium] cellulosi]CDZ24707.1 DNA mismatch repair protein MutS [[Clostridium] cellulosi]
MSEMTPMMRQYLKIKEKHKDEILFFRLGDFYEMFFDDADIAARELELTLTGKDCGLEERAPMCGIPYHSCESYIARLLAKGYKVAICEQTEDPALAKGLVRREIVRVITPGTVIEGSMLDEAKNNFLASIYVSGNKAGICFADVSTGEAYVTLVESDDIATRINNENGRYMPSEAIINNECAALKGATAFLKEKINCTVNVFDDDRYDSSPEPLLKQFNKETLEEIGLEGKPETVMAMNALLSYLKDTQINGLERLDTIYYYSEEQYMRLDLSTRRNLELCETMRGREKRGTLLWVLDKTKTAMGKRLLRTWIEQPLLNCAEIVRRHNAVGELVSDSIMRADLADGLTGVYDLERLMTRIVYGSANARELRSLAQTAEKLPSIKERMAGVNSQLLKEIYAGIDPLQDVFKLIDDSIVEDPPALLKEGGIIKDGYNAEVDELREAMTNGHGFLAKIEAAEREKTGIKNLRIGYNRVFGYYIEVTKSNLSQVPDYYIRKQTLTNCERYITQELKELESRVLGAQERIKQLEFQLFDEVRKKVAEQLHRIQRTAKSLAKLDVLVSFAQTAVDNNYCCPDVSLDGKIIIKDGRHPVVEMMMKDTPFVPNDTLLDLDENRTAIITGPNMAGKSTYMRQVALIVLMSQIGSFVPASSAKLGIVDSIFTRVGASDDLASGQSTFMVEMSEVANILQNATRQSLLIFDEIGRGTSTFDGMSIARAVVEYVNDKKRLGAKTLFATHYHELTEMESMYDGIKNYNVAVKKHGDDITFLRRIIAGGADDSYGIEVAKLAGLPNSVISRSKEILKQLNAGQPVAVRRKKLAEVRPQEPAQVSFTNPTTDKIMSKLRTIDANTLSPIEALNILFELCKLAQDH